MKKLKRNLALSALAIAGLVLTPRLPGRGDYTENQPVARVCSSKGIESKLEIPHYSKSEVPPFYCSRYVQFAAKDLFGLEYSRSDAWNRRYDDQLVGPITNAELKTRASEGKLIPGDIIGFYNPSSSHNQDIDKNGKPVQYTHVMLFVGVDSNGNPQFAHLYGKNTLLVGSDYIKEKKLEAREQIRAKGVEKKVERVIPPTTSQITPGNYSAFKFPEEIEKIRLHSERRGIEPELLMAVRMAENGSVYAYGIIPTGPQKTRYNQDKGYEYQGKFYSYESETEKNMCWAAATLGKRYAEFKSATGNSDTSGFIDWVAKKYSTKGSGNWERIVRKYYTEFKRN